MELELVFGTLAFNHIFIQKRTFSLITDKGQGVELTEKFFFFFCLANRRFTSNFVTHSPS